MSAVGFRSDSKVDTLRVPPQSIPAEQSVLGGLMLAPEWLPRVAAVLSEDDFYRRDHRLIYRAIRAQATAGKPIDHVTLGEWLEANGLADKIGGTGYLIDLVSTTPSAANVTSYAEIVRENAMLRQVIEAGTAAVNDGFQPDGRAASEIVGATARALESINARTPMQTTTAGALLAATYQAASAGYERGEHELGLLTGFTALDTLTAGLAPEDFVIAAARPGIGKTVLALNIADHCAQRGKRVGFWSLEMAAHQLGMRLAAARAGVPHYRLKRPWLLGDEDFARLNDAARLGRDLDLVVLDAPDLTIDQFEGQAHQLHTRKPLDLIVIDYLGLMTPPKAERHELAMGEIGRRLKKIAKRMRVPILGLHQLNRGPEARTSKEPMVADLRDTGRFEQDADMIWLLHRERYYHPKADDDCQLHVAKQRSGETARLGLGCELAMCRFTDYDGKWIPYAERQKRQASDNEDGFDDDGGAKPARKSRPRKQDDGRTRAAGGDE